MKRKKEEEEGRRESVRCEGVTVCRRGGVRFTVFFKGVKDGLTSGEWYDKYVYSSRSYLLYLLPQSTFEAERNRRNL